MKRTTFIVISLFFVLIMPLVSFAANINVSIGIPSPFVFAGPPDVVVVPSGDAYVYMVPDTPGLYFYDNYWYRYDRDRWYRSRTYNGSWAYIDFDLVPGYILDVPPDYYLRLPRGYHRIHYRDFNRHWRNWDRERYWNRYDWYNRQHREHERWQREHPRPQHDLHRDRDRHDDHGRGDLDRRDDRRHDSGRHDNGKHDSSKHDFSTRESGKHDSDTHTDSKHDGKHDYKDRKKHLDDRRDIDDIR